jgi:hypothetical protein
LEAAENGKVMIVSSALTLAEVLALRGRDPFPPDRRAMVEAFFHCNAVA